MRIGVISDLHVDDSAGRSIIDATIFAARNASLGALVIPGDISSDWRTSLDAIAAIEDGLGVPVLFVPGNHDLWNKKHPGETAELAQLKLSGHPGCLSGRCVSIEGWYFVGETGWYDGSLAEGRFTAEEVASMQFGGRTWQDSLFTKWAKPMADKADEFASSLASSLAGLDPARTIAVTHVVPRLEFTVQPPAGIWSFFNGLLGSASYGQLFSKIGVRAALCGHVHYRSRLVADGIEWICACLGNPEEWRLKDLAAELDNAMAILDL